MVSKIKKYSWGNYPVVKPSEVWPIYWRDQDIPFNSTDKNFLCYGQGRSYGDSCLNETGILIDTKNLNRFIYFDEKHGLIRCEAGITFKEILQVIVQSGWFLPVVPGTQFISLGGAIANDIHGKNHHQASTFGRYVRCFELIKSDGQRLFCSPDNNLELFSATIGGLGLTGLIIWAEIQLIPIKNPYIDVEYIKFQHIDNFVDLNKSSEENFSYTVAWLDCVIRNKKFFGRGIFMRANHNHKEINLPYSSRSFSIPCYLPQFVLNRLSIRMFNEIYYRKFEFYKKITIHYEPFFFQLDAIRNWNRIYGKRGFLQYQCVVPDISISKEILFEVAKSQQRSFLSVLKTFGEIQSLGLLSFPQKGITLALDFPNYDASLLSLLNKLDQIVVTNNGKVYPAKDARMSSYAFQKYYPNWRNFLKYKDTRFNSNFWQRVSNACYE